MTAVLEARNIVKRFGGVVALNGVSFDLLPGEIHALVGENGAGKSTLIKVLSGIHPAGSFEGSLHIQGAPAALRTVADAEAAGIAVIYQELALVGEMTVAENIFLGHEPLRNGFVDWLRMDRDARALLRRFNLNVNPETRVADLGVGHQQLVEIVKALERNSRILILDEPTAALSGTEVDVLLNILRDLRRQGFSIIYISHKLEEVFSIADRITVLRDGVSVAASRASDTDRHTIIRQMVGREITEFYPRRHVIAGSALLKVHGLTVGNPKTGKAVLHDISFEARAGEVLGIGGLMGAGRSELLLHLFGAWGERLGGHVELNRATFDRPTPTEAIRRGLVLVSEDRKRYGLVLSHSIGFNLSLSSLQRVSRNGWIDQHDELRRNREVFSALRIKAPDLEARTSGLSGGNQQKVVLGKALMTEPRVVFLDEPTRGIDVGAKLEVYELINQLIAAGKAVVLVSSELPELMGMSDRIVMISRGRLSRPFERSEATPEILMASAMS
jgi:D-xylose transport system ATP-binding protein